MGKVKSRGATTFGGSEQRPEQRPRITRGMRSWLFSGQCRPAEKLPYLADPITQGSFTPFKVGLHQPICVGSGKALVSFDALRSICLQGGLAEGNPLPHIGRVFIYSKQQSSFTLCFSHGIPALFRSVCSPAAFDNRVQSPVETEPTACLPYSTASHATLHCTVTPR